MKILFLCVANMARSQIAHGLAQSMQWNIPIEIESAGSNPTEKISHHAKIVLEEENINTQGLYPKHVSELDKNFLEDLDFIITLCEEDWCPSFNPPKTKKLHWPIKNPVGIDKLEAFRIVKEEIKKKLIEFQKTYILN